MTTIFNRISAMTPEQRTALTEEFGQASRLATAEPIAVVGIGCRLPGDVTGPQRYWQFLTGRTDAISEVPPDRWDADELYDPDPAVPGRMASKWGGFLDDIGGFDADFFGISPREAEAMDPQQRVLLEVACEALENAGIPLDGLSGTRAAVMAGVYYSEYQVGSATNPDGIDAYSATGNAHSITVGRIAYQLGLRGPAMAIDTACSSSLVAVHLACESLRLHSSDLALAGGVNLILRPETQLALSKWGMLSPRGRCNAFDAGADGFVRGEGAGVVVLKRLIDAVNDGDQVLAVVRGSAVNQDGRSNGLTAPNTLAQQEVIDDALYNADVTADSVHFIETHGTGTALGDPIEFDALSAVYGQGDGRCALGAVKTNFGHLEAAAGIAGFIKTVLAVRNGKVPPNLNFTSWNPAIDAAATRLFVPTDTDRWPDGTGPRRAAVSSFGLGGTNAHIVVEQGPEQEATPHPTEPADEPAVTTLPVSAKSPDRVAAWAAVLADWLDGDGAAAPLADIARALHHRQAQQAVTAAVCARDRAQAVTGLRALAAGHSAPGVVDTQGRQDDSGITFVYSGQGAQWPGMGRRLLADEPAFAAAVAELEPVFVEQVGFSLRQVLEAGEPVDGIDRIQPVLVGMQLALTAMWRHHGVEPDVVIGHSMGEVTAAVVAGALSPADGLRVIATRSRLMSRLSGQGAMALVELDAGAAEKLIADHPGLTVAVYASPGQTVIAGPPDEIDAAVSAVDESGLLARRIDVDVASHHPTVDPILAELREALADLAPQSPKIRLLSTVGSQTDGDAIRFDAEYWAANLRDPVRFSQAIRAAGADHSTFVEVSPHPLLTHAITEAVRSVRQRGDLRVTGTLTRDGDETLTFHTQLATVRPPSAQRGTAVAGSYVELPPTPWLHTRYWTANRPNAPATAAHPLFGQHIELPSGPDHAWQADVGTELLGWLADHRVHGRPVLPAAAFAEIALAAGSEGLGVPVCDIRMDRLEVEQMLPLDGHTRVTTQLARTEDADAGARVEIHSHDGNWRRHAVAHVEVSPRPTAPGPLAPSDDGDVLSPPDFYTALRRTGAYHGPAFAALTRIVRAADGWAESEIALPDEATPNRCYRMHPVLLDAALQSLAAAMPTESLGESGEVTYLPVSIEQIRVLAEPGRHARCRAELTGGDDDGAGQLGRVTLTDEAGNPTVQVTGVYLRRIQRRTVPLPLSQKIFDTTWVPTPNPEERSDGPAGSWLLLSDADAKTVAHDFGARFESPTRRVVNAELADDPAMLDAFGETAADAEFPPAGVVAFIAARDVGAADPDRAQELVWAISAAIRAVVDGWHGQPPRLWLVSADGLALHDESGDPAIGALKGLIRVLAYEHPGLRASLVDLEQDRDDTLTALAAELAAPGGDDVVAWRAGRRYAERLSRATLAEDAEHRHRPLVRGDGSYIITGGLGGVGSAVARWLVDSGAGRVVLNSRSDPSDEQQAHLTELQGRAQTEFVTGDVAEPGVAERLIAVAEDTGMPLRGVVHAAAVIDDELITALSRESLQRVWAPKVTGALRLHEALAEDTRDPDRQLDWWAGFSSVASLLGSPGQAAYACANAWLDALVAWRRAAGLPATAINWGQWSDVGAARALTLSVLDPISPAEGIEALQAVLAADPGRIGVARLRLDRAATAFPEIGRLGYFADVVEELADSGADDDWAGPAALREMEPAAIQQTVVERLRNRVSALMGYAEAVDTGEPLTELGLDSLMAVRIRNTIRGDFGVEPPVAMLLRGATITDLAADLIGQLDLTGQDHTQPRSKLGDRVKQRAAARRQAASERRAGQRL